MGLKVETKEVEAVAVDWDNPPSVWEKEGVIYLLVAIEEPSERSAFPVLDLTTSQNPQTFHMIQFRDGHQYKRGSTPANAADGFTPYDGPVTIRNDYGGGS